VIRGEVAFRDSSAGGIHAGVTNVPLLDQFQPPFNEQVSWSEFHGQWPAVMVQQLKSALPGFADGDWHRGVRAIPSADDGARRRGRRGRGGRSASRPALSSDTELPDLDEYEVRVFDASRGRRLVAAIELVIRVSVRLRLTRRVAERSQADAGCASIAGPSPR